MRGTLFDGEIKTKFRVLVSPPSNNFLATSATLFTGEEIVKCELVSSLLTGEPTNVGLLDVPKEFEGVATNFVGVCCEDLPDDPVTGTY